MPWPGFEPGEWDPQSHVLSKLHHQGLKQMKNRLKRYILNLLTYYNMLFQIYKYWVHQKRTKIKK